MAEGVLFNVAESILTKLGSLALQEIGLLCGLQDELKRLQTTLRTIKAVLLDAEKQYHMSHEVREWLGELKDTVYDADDLLDDISTEELSQRLMSGNKVTKEVRIFFSCSNRIAFGLKMAHKIKEIRAKLDEVAENRKFHLNQNLVESIFMDHSRDTHSSAPHVVVGREDDKKKVISLLLEDHKEAMVVIPIVGMGGLGKTTLAQMIFDDEMVKEKFELKAWVCVSDIFDVKSIIEKIIGCIDGRRPSGNMEMEVLKNMLSEKIKGKKYFFVLDDVWNEKREKWISLSDLITRGARGSRILVTTRSKIVADITCTSQIHELKGLSEQESQDLFQKVAFKHGQAPNEEFGKLGEEIVAKCGGLPLAIKIIGSLLYTKKKESEWRYFKDEEFSTLDPKIDVIEILKLSYNHLPSHLKQCFAYCSLFPKDCILDVSTLINYWKAHGYVEGNSYNCLKYLVQRSFFQVKKENEEGKIVSCSMHDFMHDLATLVSGEEVKLLVHGSFNGTTITGRTRHISLHDVPINGKWQDLARLLQGKKVRTLILVFQYGAKLVGEEWATILSELKYLRVLSMQYVNFKKLPPCIGRLKHLRQFELYCNSEIERIPNCITRLHNLQVLKFDQCQSLNDMPRDIKKLVNLIHLIGFEWEKLKEMPRGIGELTSLEVLPLYILPQTRTKSTGGLDELHKLNKLKGKLKILNLQYVEKGALECEAANLKDKSHLQSLVLSWRDHREVEDISSEEKSLDALQPNVYLRELRLDYYGGVRFPMWVSSLENLVNIEIVGCNNCKSLPSLDGLPSLQHLLVGNLSNLKYMIDNNVENTQGGGRLCFFPRLKTLDLSSCPKLKGWWRSTEELLHYQLPCLSKLMIHSCLNFKGWMPLLPSLKILILDKTDSELLEETLKQAKSLSTSASTSTSLSPLRYLCIGEIGGWDFLREEALRGLASLRSLDIHNVADASVLVPWLHHLSSLESLSIYGDKVVELFEENNIELIQHCLQNLRTLSIVSCSKIKSLPNVIQHLTPLETLSIKYCDEMKALPAWMCNLASLKTLEINGCPHLSERCWSNQGEDWSFISHIPNINVDYAWVQSNGRYESSPDRRFHKLIYFYINPTLMNGSRVTSDANCIQRFAQLT